LFFSNLAYNVSTSFRKTVRSWQGRATQWQIGALITYLEQYPHVAGKFTTINNNIQLQGSWEDFTFLNSLGSKDKEKDVKSWKTVSI